MIMQNLQEYARNRWKQAKIDGVCINHTNRLARLSGDSPERLKAMAQYLLTRSLKLETIIFAEAA